MNECIMYYDEILNMCYCIPNEEVYNITLYFTNLFLI